MTCLDCFTCRIAFRGELLIPNQLKIRQKGVRGSDFLRGVPGSPLFTMIWTELGMSNMDRVCVMWVRGGHRCGGVAMVVHLNGGGCGGLRWGWGIWNSFRNGWLNCKGESSLRNGGHYSLYQL